MSKNSIFNGFPGLKVVHLTSVHTPLDSRIFQKECRSLVAAGCRVILIAPYDQIEEIDGVEVLPVKKRQNRLGRVIMTARETVSLAAKENADVYHLHDPELLFWVDKLKNLGSLVIYDMHEDLPLQVKNKVWIPKIFRPLVSSVIKILEKVLIGKLPVIMAESSYKKSRPWLNESMDILNFPRLDWLSRLATDRSGISCPKIGYIGAVTDDRGSLVVLDAMKILMDDGVEVEFDCVGPVSSVHRGEIDERISSYGLHGVTLAGYLPPGEGWKRIAGCHMGVALLKPIPNYIESYPTKIFEYMGMGLPVIVSNFPLYKEIIDRCECGFAVDPLDAVAVAKAISYLVGNPEKALEMGRNGQQFALSDFNWKSEEKKLLRFYNDLLLRK